MSFLKTNSGVVRRVVAVAILGIGLTACGSSDSADEPAEEATTEEAATEESADEAPTGDPIKVMTVTTLNANGPTYENIKIAAEIAADHINSNGGINGRPLEVIVCDEQFDPAIAATCARDAVEEGVVSVVGSFTYFAEAIVPVIAESDITWFGACCPISPSELTSPHSFNIGNQPMYAVGMVRQAVEDGCGRPSLRGSGADQTPKPPAPDANSTTHRAAR